MCLPCWNFTGGAFAVFGCFERLKCCGLTGLPWANFPFAALWPAVVAVFAWFGLLAPFTWLPLPGLTPGTRGGEVLAVCLSFAALAVCLPAWVWFFLSV